MGSRQLAKAKRAADAFFVLWPTRPDPSASVITSKPAIHEQVKTGQWEAVRD